MKPLIVLLTVFIIASFAIKIRSGHYNTRLSACISLSVMLLFTATGHFAFSKGMAMMIPGFIPFKTGLIYLTGLFEIAAAIGLLIPATRVRTGWLLIFFFVLVLPANINAAIHHIDYQNGTYEGNGLTYLWFRIPLQFIFIIWTYGCSIR